MPAPTTSTFPYRLARLGVVMRRRPGVRTEAEGVLNPASATAPDGTVLNVVFPTAIERIGGRLFGFYGMADSAIGVAEALP